MVFKVVGPQDGLLAATGLNGVAGTTLEMVTARLLQLFDQHPVAFIRALT